MAHLIALTLALTLSSGINDDARLAVAGVLDDFHRAASEADGERYFAHFAEDGIFLGTDADERWDVAAFREYAAPYFAKGQGWTYVASERHVSLGPAGQVAWFDERLQNEKYGEVRGSGSLIKVGEQWRIALYNLAFPVPNALAGGLVAEAGKSLAPAELASHEHELEFARESGETRRVVFHERVDARRLKYSPGELPVVVLLPSATYSARGTWDLPLRDYSVMDALARRGFDVFAYEPAGFGASDPPEAGGDGARASVSDLLAVLNHIAELRGQRRVALVGPSWGAQLAGRFAVEHPERVRGVVLYGFTWEQRIPEQVVDRVFGAGVLERASREVTRELALADFIPTLHEADVPEAFARHLLAQGESVPSAPLRDFVHELPLVDASRVSAACLMLYGEFEFATPDPRDPRPDEPDSWVPQADHRRDARAFYAALSGPRHWIELPRAGHGAHLDKGHRLFQLCLAGWLERLEP